ncbi:MAG: Fic family protein [Nanoarchaeota archaeon]
MSHMDNILREVDRILGVVNTHPEFSHCVDKEKRLALKEDARKYSLKIEGIENSGAYSHLKNTEDCLYQQGLGISTLTLLGNLIDPGVNPEKRFRNVDPAHPDQVVEIADTGSLKVHPPVAREVIGGMMNLIDYLDLIDDHPIIRASEAHLEIARIHPYGGGNGRAARLIQNYCLDERGYPVAVISSNERSFYQSLIQNALEERVSEKSSPFSDKGKNVMLFHEFIASRVLNSVVDLQRELSEKRAFMIDLKGHYDPGLAYTIAQIIRNHSRFPRRKGVKANIDKKTNGKKGTSIKIIGDIGRKDVENLLESLSDRYRIKYEIKTLGC